MFDEKTQQELGCYVYMLIDPQNEKPFYIGKGSGNRVFEHVENVKNGKEKNEPKGEKIKQILKRKYNNKVQHIIVRHRMDDNTAYLVEASLIDAFNFCYSKLKLTNSVKGHGIEHGLKLDEEIKKMYSTQPIGEIPNDCVVININKWYPKCKNAKDIYEKTRKSWAMDKKKVKSIKTVLSEYKGLIVGVYSIEKPEDWKEQKVPYNKGAKKQGRSRIRWAFKGKEADECIKQKYYGKCLPSYKKRSPILYSSFVNKLVQSDKSK